MLLERGVESRVPFLLVIEDGVTAAPAGTTGVTAEYQIGVTGDWLPAVDVYGGPGWYEAVLPPINTNGYVIMRASGAGTLEWRDIHQVVDSVSLVVIPRLLRAGTQG